MNDVSATRPKSVTYGQYDARATVTFPAAKFHHPFILLDVWTTCPGLLTGSALAES